MTALQARLNEHPKGWREISLGVGALYAEAAGFACTQDQLAGATALSRNTVGEILRGFAEAGMVVAHYGQIKIVDAARLMRVADPD